MSSAGQKRKSKADSLTQKEPLSLGDEDSESIQDGAPKKKKQPKKPLDSRFGGKTEEEIMQLLLPDHLKPDLDIVFIGINPGLLSAYLGHHYCNANNHFWPCMFESGLIPRRMTYKEDAECLDYGIGFTNIVPRTTRSSNNLSRKEIKEWSQVMIERMKELKPLIACFNGKGIYEIFSGVKKCEVGIQTEPLPDTETVVYVMPSTSGRAASHPRRVDKLKFFYELKELRDQIKVKKGITASPLKDELNQTTLPQLSSTDTNSLSCSESSPSLNSVPVQASNLSPIPTHHTSSLPSNNVPSILPHDAMIQPGISKNIDTTGVTISPYFLGSSSNR